MDLKEISKICNEMEKKKGTGSVYTLNSKKANLSVPRWETGIEDLDAVIGGGMPKGRVIEIFGPESSGKTSLAFHLISRCELGVYIPIEGTFDSDRAKSFGISGKQMIIVRCDYGEDALNAIMKFAKAGVPLIVLDSVPACQPKDDIEKVEKDAENETRIGGVARLFSKMLPSIERTCEMTGTTIILINQVRDNMNAMLFGDKDSTPGGRAIKFYSSIRIKVARRAWIEVPNKNPKISAATEKIGIVIKAKIVKSKVSNPFGEVEMPMFFKEGFQSFDDVKSIRMQYMKNNKKRNAEEDEEEEEDDE
jgi:recombination protein RecA